MDGRAGLLAYFGHHKAASTWIHAIVQDACREAGLNGAYVHHPRQFDGDLRSFVERGEIDFLTYANADLAYVRDVLETTKGFHVIRDPRDLVVSAYFSHLHSHPTDDFPRLVAHRDRLRSVSKDEGLILEMEFRRPSFDHITTWDYALPGVLEWKMEELIADPPAGFARIFGFLGLVADGDGRGGRGATIARDRLLEIVEAHSFSKVTGGRKPGEEDVKSHYRKGVPGDWKNHFQDRHKDIFKSMYGDMLVKLGYEDGDDW